MQWAIKINSCLLLQTLLFWTIGSALLGGATARNDQFVALSGGPSIPSTISETSIPALLSKKDIALYQKVFRMQEMGDWKDASILIKDIKNKILLGHVKFQRYMHPTKYRSKYNELSQWLTEYSDHPGAKRIYKLALRRRAGDQKKPKRPKISQSTIGYVGIQSPETYRINKKKSKAKRRQIKQIKRYIRSNLRKDRISVSEKYLSNKAVRTTLDEIELDGLLSEVAAARYYYGQYRQAHRLSKSVANRSRAYFSNPDWIAGLSAWWLGNYETARLHFEHLTQSKIASAWIRSAAGYWAARANLITGRPELVNDLLAIAAKNPRTFYGLIAARQLGVEPDYHWMRPPLTRLEYHDLLSKVQVRRTIALTQIGRHDLADSELRHAYNATDANLAGAFLGLANRLGLPAAQLKLARHIKAIKNQHYDGALFPLSPWQPRGGFAIDQALVFAFTRQESGFNTKAKSVVGARGLMQLMPRTASFVSRDKSLRRENRSKLYQPELNLALGQRYLEHLLKNTLVNGNLFRLAVGYNAGPGNLKKWHRKIKTKDPLLFIESIPSRETRIFVEKVLTNFWIYRERLNQDTPSLDAVATGNIPVYLALDGASLRIAKNARN